MDRLDVTDRHYDRKYQDMQDRLDNLYDRIDDIEGSIADVIKKMNGASGEQITVEALYSILQDFDILYEKMSDADKKQFFQNFNRIKYSEKKRYWHQVNIIWNTY